MPRKKKEICFAASTEVAFSPRRIYSGRVGQHFERYFGVRRSGLFEKKKLFILALAA